MRVSLLHSENAGGSVSLDQLESLITGHGHVLTHVVDDRSDVHTLLQDHVEVVVACGGDGTVAAAARYLAGRGVPLAILPLGTANNIAKSLGVDRSLDELISSWDFARRRPFDLGVVRAGSGDCTFVESVGLGLVAEVIAALPSHPGPEDESPEQQVQRALQVYLDVLERFEARPCGLRVDGQAVDGDFLLVEIMNISTVGPNLVFAPDADPSDGVLSVVRAGEAQRETLMRHLRRRIQGHDERLELPTMLARHVELIGDETMHVDDQMKEWPVSGGVSARIVCGALDVLG